MDRIQDAAAGRPSRSAVFAALDEGLTDLARVGVPACAGGGSRRSGEVSGTSKRTTRSAIEGNTLALRQVRALLDDGRAIGDKEMREYLEVRGLRRGRPDWVYREATGAGEWSVRRDAHTHRAAPDRSAGGRARSG